MARLASILAMVLVAGASWANGFTSCFIPGELIEYKIYWMGIPLAWSTISTDTINEDGRKLIRIRMVAQSYGAYTHIYKVDDVTEVVIDPETGLPVRHDLVLNEGTIHKSQLTTFYHARKVAVFQDRISKDIRDVPVESDTQEIYSFIYSNRNGYIKELAARSHKLLVAGKIYDLGLNIVDNDDVKLPDYGKVPSIEIEPLADFDGIFLRQGKVFFWVSKQKARVVTCIKAKVAVGWISAKLQRVSSPGKGFWTERKKGNMHE